MIRFFRTLRQRLLAENRVSKYLLYAAGEIVLVVIGILIALQVNNWNEARKLRNKEYETLRRLEGEFLENHEKLDSIYLAHKEINRCLRALMAALGPNPKPIASDSLDTYMKELSHIPIYKPLSASVNSLLTTGNLGIISNDTLRLKISRWPEQLADYQYEADINYDLYNFQILPYLATQYLYRNTQIDAGKGDAGKSNFFLNTQKLLSDSTLENLAELKRVDSESLEIDARELIHAQMEILDLIREELLKFN